MIKVGILERCDVILETDFVRYLDIQYTGQSDTVITRSAYSGAPINFFRWVTVKEAMWFHWIGKTVAECEDKMYGMEKPHQPVARFEFVRGAVPDSHKLNLKFDE